jgi:uncharacterized membrane protein YdfJ with MMPL/SSD domain
MIWILAAVILAGLVLSLAAHSSYISRMEGE